MKKFYGLKYDSVFKNVFFKNKELLKWLLNHTLNKNDINNINILNCELTKDRTYIKSKMVDVLIESNRVLYNVELNTNFNEEVLKRNYVYQCAQIVNLVHVNKDYNNSLLPIIQINYNFKSVCKSNQFINNYTDMELNTHERYGFFKEIINIDIDKYIDKWYNLDKDKNYYQKYKHFLLLGMNREDLKELEDEDIMVKEIKKEVLKLNNDSEFYQFLTDEEDTEILCNSYYSRGVNEGLEKGLEKGIEQGLEKGIEQGLEQGIMETNIENAKKMKKEKMPLNLIKKITGLDINTIRSL